MPYLSGPNELRGPLGLRDQFLIDSYYLWTKFTVDKLPTKLSFTNID